MRHRRQIFIELTPLLDVIMILLFLIMSKDAEAVRHAEEKAEAQMAVMTESLAQSELENHRIADKLEKEKERADALKSFSEYALITTLSIEITGPGERCVRILAGEEEELIYYNWDKIIYAQNAITATFTRLLSGNQDKPAYIVFYIDDESMYLDDYRMVMSILGDLPQEDLYIRTLTKEEADRKKEII